MSVEQNTYASSADHNDLSVGNQNYSGAVGDDSTSSPYNPGGMFTAIQDEIAKMKKIIASGGHVSEFMTAELMYLMQGFGGEYVGLDGQAVSALNGAQGAMSQAWSYIHSATGGTSNAQSNQSPDADFNNAINNAKDAVSQAVKTGRITKGQAANILDALDQIKKTLTDFKSWVQEHASDDKGSAAKNAAWLKIMDTVKKKISQGDTIGAMQYLAQPHSVTVQTYDKKGHLITQKVEMQGDPEWLNNLNSNMSSGNQQVTGLSQEANTLAKTDAKMMQAEQTGYSNFLQALKKLNSYLVQLQRTQ